MYLDIFFIVNLGMNSFLLWIASIINKRESSWKKLLAGAAAGTLLAVLWGSWNWNIYLERFLIVVAPLLMVLVAFYPVKVRELVFLTGTTFFAAFLLGGLLEALLINAAGEAGRTEVNVWWLAGGCLLIYSLIRVFRPYLEDKSWQGALKASIKIRLGECQKTVSALMDTGNRLRDPFAQKPVILIDYRELEELWPHGLSLTGLEKEFDPVKVLEEISGHPEARRFYLIPFAAIGGAQEMLLGFRPDEVVVFSGENGREISSRVAVGVYKKSFGCAEEIQALMPPEVMQMAG